MVPKRIYYLLDRFFDQTIERQEREELSAWINQADESMVEQALKVSWENHRQHTEMPAEMSERILETVFRQKPESSDELYRRRTIPWVRISAAAAVLIAVAFMSWLWLKQDSVPVVAKQLPAKEQAPKSSGILQKAVLTLSDGSQIYPDSASNGPLAEDDNSTIVKLADGKLAYRPGTGASSQNHFNTLTTPYGVQYELTLPDGTKAWLNAASSITFPARFGEKERRVFITGEVYFEVTAVKNKKGNKKVPFIAEVSRPGKPKEEVEVLGTRFNINAYDNEGSVKATLVEGVIRIRSRQGTKILSAGQQARLTEDGSIRLLNAINVEETIAWKQGYFHFERAELSAVLREAARWYDVEIVYEGTPRNDRFSGKIERTVPLSTFIKWLKWSDVNITTEGNKIIVKN